MFYLIRQQYHRCPVLNHRGERRAVSVSPRPRLPGSEEYIGIVKVLELCLPLRPLWFCN